MNVPNQSSIYAEQGTDCHSSCEAYDITGRIDTSSFTEDWQEQATKDAITQRDIVLHKLNIKPRNVQNEVRVDLDAFSMPDVFGTVDVVGYNPGTRNLLILDYKFGQGVPVSVKNNKQLLIYALGCLALHPETVNVILSVVQPRVYAEPQVWETTVENLKAWYATMLFPAYQASQKEDAPYVVGDVQCRWCATAKAGCPAQSEKLMDMLPATKEETVTVKTDGLTTGEILDRLSTIEVAIKQYRSNALQSALNGEDVEGYKLVHKLKRATWKDAKKAEGMLARKKLKQNERFKMTLLTPPQAKKLLASRGTLTPRMLGALESNITRGLGDVILAPNSDSRPDYVLFKPEEMLPENVSLDDIL